MDYYRAKELFKIYRMGFRGPGGYGSGTESRLIHRRGVNWLIGWLID